MQNCLEQVGVIVLRDIVMRTPRGLKDERKCEKREMKERKRRVSGELQMCLLERERR